MKKVLLGLLVLVGFQTANATSLVGKALDYSKVVIANGRIAHELTVYVDGTVTDRNPGISGASSHAIRVVTRLTGEQMDRINRLANRATPEIKRFETSHAMCFAPAITIAKYTAYNTHLRSGDMCDGGFNVNIRPAAKKLVNVLNALERAAHANVSFAQIDGEVEAALN